VIRERLVMEWIQRLGAGNLKPDFFRQTLANFFRKAVMHPPCAFFGGIEHGHRRGCGDSNYHPDQSRKDKSKQCCNLQPEGIRRTEVSYDAESQQKNTCGKRGERNESDIDNTVHFLPAAAALADGEVSFVVAAHLRREAGDIVAPACQNFPDNRISALLTHRMNKIMEKSQPDRLQRLALRCQKHAVLKKTAALGQRLFRAPPGYLRVVVLF
jgi:hypothetical protein